MVENMSSFEFLIVLKVIFLPEDGCVFMFPILYEVLDLKWTCNSIFLKNNVGTVRRKEEIGNVRYRR